MRALQVTRDQIKNISSEKGRRYVSLDFNDVSKETAAKKLVRGIEIIIPNDFTPDEYTAASKYVKQLQIFFRFYGLKVPLRGVSNSRGRSGMSTRKQSGRGIKGFFHTEPFFIRDKRARDIIVGHAREYALLLFSTLGQLPGVTFIQPHTQRDPGATLLENGMTEREFAKYLILPHLTQHNDKSIPVHAFWGTKKKIVQSDGPQVTFTETT